MSKNTPCDSSDVLKRAQSWISDDICDSDKSELQALVASQNTSELSERMAGPLEFGTAGLRGELGAGPNRMNLAVVVRSCAGIAEYILKNRDPNAKPNGIVIGHDARRMGREFAEAAAGVFAAYAIPCHLFPSHCPTPLVAYATTRLNASASIMITASHNPPQYNGMKVYWSNGAQIIPPHDSGIADEITALPGARHCQRLPLSLAIEKGLVLTVPDAITSDYLREVAGLSLHSSHGTSLSVVYTPLHGVGQDLACRALRQVGFEKIYVVDSQARPDGAFPTVQSPNPEDITALALAIELAREKDADLILANDPDADRLAVAVRSHSQGNYIPLNGNQIGVLFAQYFLEHAALSTPRSLYMCSIVSSPMLKAMALAKGVLFEEVLTGFKWIANKAIDLRASKDAAFIFGYEEAIGFTTGELVRDKDGISAAALFAEIAAFYAKQGLSIIDKLETMYREYGLFASAQYSISRPGISGSQEIEAIMTQLRTSPPSSLAGRDVAYCSDYLKGIRTDRLGNQVGIDLPRSNILAFELDDSSRIIARPSGTEPKIKFYFDVREEIPPGTDFQSAQARANKQLATIQSDFLAIVQGT